ncbi:MAG: Rieske (2Fe-2S) protein [Actinobacteria bacterium]|nr:Rieske (2Fe-2S) protein [Actinomycetota bacterium]
MDGRLRRCANRFGMEFMTKKEVSGLSESFNRDEYNSPEIFALEMQKIYGTNWCFAGLSEELTKIGDRLVVDIGNESVLVLRNRENQLRAFYNVCQHRGSQLCDASGSGFGAAITCPYHAWSYSVEGALVATPLHEKDSIDRSTLGLKQVKVDEWQGAIFISLDPNAEPLTKWLDDHYSRPRELEKFDLANLKNARTTIDEVEANWKVWPKTTANACTVASCTPNLSTSCRFTKPATRFKKTEPTGVSASRQVQLHCHSKKTKTCRYCLQWMIWTTIQFSAPMSTRIC